MTVNNLRRNTRRYDKKNRVVANERIRNMLNKQKYIINEGTKTDLLIGNYLSMSLNDVFSHISATKSDLFEYAKNPNKQKIEYDSRRIRDVLRLLSVAESYKLDIKNIQYQISQDTECYLKEKYRNFKKDLICETDRLIEESKTGVEIQKFMSSKMVEQGIQLWLDPDNSQAMIFSIPITLSIESYLIDGYYDEDYEEDDDDEEKDRRAIMKRFKLPDDLRLKTNAHLGVMINSQGQFICYKLFKQNGENLQSFHSSNTQICLGNLNVPRSDIANIIKNNEWGKVKTVLDSIRVMLKTVDLAEEYGNSFSLNSGDPVEIKHRKIRGYISEKTEEFKRSE